MLRKIAIFLAVLNGTVYAQALREAKVLAAVPIIGQVATQQETCRNERVYKPGNTSGFGAVVGGLAGAIVGNQFGKGDGRTATTVVGGIAGGVAGNSLEKPGPGTSAVEVRCSPQVVTETRTLGYQVIYELDGEQYNVRMDRDPGPRLLVQ